MSQADGLSHLVEEGVIDAVHARLMSGKEATVYVVEREGNLGAAKVYKARDERTFKKTASYVEGRNQTRNSRDRRAMHKKTSYGRGLIEESWQDMEFHALRAAFDAGVRVPEPYFLYENVLFMELVVDQSGAPASRLADFTFTAEEATAAAPGGVPAGEDAAWNGTHSRRSVGLQRAHGRQRPDHHRPAPGRRRRREQQRPPDPAPRSAQRDRAPGALRRAPAALRRLRRRPLSAPRARDPGHGHGSRGGRAPAARRGRRRRPSRPRRRARTRRPRQGPAPGRRRSAGATRRTAAAPSKAERTAAAPSKAERTAAAPSKAERTATAPSKAERTAAPSKAGRTVSARSLRPARRSTARLRARRWRAAGCSRHGSALACRLPPPPAASRRALSAAANQLGHF